MPEQIDSTPVLSVLAPIEPSVPEPAPAAEPAPAPVEPDPMMDAEARVTYARAILANGPAKKAEFLAFMRGYLRDLTEPAVFTMSAPTDTMMNGAEFAARIEALNDRRSIDRLVVLDAQENVPSPDVDEVRYHLPVELTDTGAIHLPISANRTYALDEALALARKITRLAKK